MSFAHPALSGAPILDAIDRERRKPGECEVAALLGRPLALTVSGNSFIEFEHRLYGPVRSETTGIPNWSNNKTISPTVSAIGI